MDEDQSTIEDPVCGMKVDPENAAGETQYNDENWFFCSEKCKQMFLANPLLYMEKSADEENLETTIT